MLRLALGLVWLVYGLDCWCRWWSVVVFVALGMWFMVYAGGFDGFAFAYVW